MRVINRDFQIFVVYLEKYIRKSDHIYVADAFSLIKLFDAVKSLLSSDNETLFILETNDS